MTKKRRYSLTETDADTIRIALLYLIKAATKDENTILAAQAQDIYDRLLNYVWRIEK